MNALAAAEQGTVLESRAADLLGRIEEARTGGAADTGAFDNTAFQNEIRRLSPNRLDGPRRAPLPRRPGRRAAHRRLPEGAVDPAEPG